MTQRKLFTFSISRDVSSRTVRFALSYPTFLGLSFLVMLAILAIGLGVRHYSDMVVRVADYKHVVAQNNTFQSENQKYRVQTAQLGEKIDALEATARKLMVISGMERWDGLGGVGGLSKEVLQKPLSPSAGSLSAIDRYNRGVDALEGRVRVVKDYLYESAQVAAARPAFLPVNGYVTCGMGRREDPLTGSSIEHHTGIDISAPYGTRVLAPADGTVIFAGTRAGYGNIIVIDHMFGVSTRYGHLWKFVVQAGQHISRSDTIGYVGSTGRTTGPHLHFELRVHDRSVDPLRYIAGVNWRDGAALASPLAVP
ncbi:MAG TPA: M23 family metallopeptidase [Dehalococcoidia bacterium]|jgi:murein DD-endopeptidase MepM/ murein hydrolase activator NlpD|nr:M23 family metallopeptidase [Dehalococcoidia bacterium]